jgi:hypothetical protein
MLKPDIKAIRTRNNFGRARMIPAHIARPNGIAISIQFMGLEKGESFKTRASIVFLCCLMETKSSRSSKPSAIKFPVFEDIVIAPFYAIIVMMVPIYIKDPPNSFEPDGSEARGRR